MARDTRLGRIVAIKVLRSDKVADAARRHRFLKEAKAASALNHPNIVSVYDIATEDDVDFIVMSTCRASRCRPSCGAMVSS